MLVPAATAWRMASEPEWKKVPSPRFWNMCGVFVNGAMPTHCAPSPPMCVRPIVRRSGIVSAMPWQPMPAAAIEPSGTTVERLCGQPEQKYGGRASVSAAGRSRSASSSATRAVIGGELQLALQAAGHDLGDAVGVELAVGRHQRTALLVALAHDARVLGVVVEHVAQEQLDERALLLDDQDLLEAPRELAHDARLHREEHADLQDADAVARERGVVEAELAQRLAQVVVRLAGGDDAEPGVGGVERDAVEPVGGGEGLGRLQAAVVDLALHLEAEGRQQHRVLRVPPGRPSYSKPGSTMRHAVGRRPRRCRSRRRRW